MASDHFCLIWNNFQNSILSALGNLQVCQDLVDVTLMCEGKNVKAHKVILSACSPYFRNLFKETPCQHPIIILKDVTHADLTALLQFMYQGEVMVSQDCLSSFLKTAELLQISGLAGSSQSTGAENNEEPPRITPEINLEKPPDTSDTETDKRSFSSEVSFKRQKREKEPEIVENKKSSYIQPEPEQSCSYDTTSPVIVKTESLDREYDDMDTDPSNIDNYDNSNSQLEEPSILERSLKSHGGFNYSEYQSMIQSGSSNLTDDSPLTQTNVIDNSSSGNLTKKRDSRSRYQKYRQFLNKCPSRKPATCPHCNTRFSQARSLKKHLKICKNKPFPYYN